MAESAQQKLQEIVDRSRTISFFGGAGVSTESGIPDFRSAGTGLYAQNAELYGVERPEEIISHSFFVSHPHEFFAYYRTNLLHPEAKPNAAHFALSVLERQGRLNGVVTQNIDGLHQMAGSRNVAEVHGSVLRNHCTGCGAAYDWRFVADAPDIPLCTECGAIVKPDVVLYEEALPDEPLFQAADWISKADALIVAGTSLSVYPAAGLVNWFRGDDFVIINRDPTPFDKFASLVIHDSIGKTFGALDLGEESTPRQ